MSSPTRWERWKRRLTLYPPNWRQISKAVRDAAQWTCQECGARHRRFHPTKGTVTYIQTAHLDHNPGNCAPENLKALCQQCHLLYDARSHAITAYMTRREGRALELFPLC